MDIPTGWSHDGPTIAKEFTFNDFKAALAFMNRAGDIADSMNHHPEWTNVYNKVNVRLTTHDEGKVTDKDLELATEMNRLAGH